MEKKETKKTNFPDKGDDKKISLRNSKYKQFDYDFALNIKENHKDLWGKYATGGSGEDRTSFTGSDAFNAWTRYREGSETESTLEWVKRRERYFDRFKNAKNSIANAVGHMKWGGYTSNFTESEIKGVVNDFLENEKTFLVSLEGGKDEYIKAETWEEAESLSKELYGDKAEVYGELVETINLEKSNKMESKYLNTKFEIKSVEEVKEEGQDFFKIEGYASVFGNIDRGNDIVLKGAFEESLKNFKPKLLWQHNMDEPIGVIKEIHEDNKGLYFKALMPKEDSLVKGRIMPQVKIGGIDSMSFGYNVEDYDLVKQEEETMRQLKKVNVWEVSLVTIPMNPQAQLTYFKSVKDMLNKVDTKDSDVLKEIKELQVMLSEKTNEENEVIEEEQTEIENNEIETDKVEESNKEPNKEEPEKEEVEKEDNTEKSKDVECLKTIKELNKFLKESGFSNKESNVIISKAKSFSRDEENEKKSRDGDLDIVNELKQIKELLKNG